MTGIDPERQERRLRWAAEQLALSPSAAPEKVRAVWLRSLPDEDFVPPSELRWALEALLRRQPEGGWEARADEAASVAEEERLRGEVEVFAEQFWDLPSDERRGHWQELMDSCAFAPVLLARLRPLEAGLAIDPREPNEEMGAVELAKYVRELFVLRPEPRRGPGRRSCTGCRGLGTSGGRMSGVCGRLVRRLPLWVRTCWIRSKPEYPRRSNFQKTRRPGPRRQKPTGSRRAGLCGSSCLSP